ncbi:IseA DL-endopeptidase inhibitor family protein [Bacillus swezeyi]|uniref:IseA DL-endopeptidase inhibitor family protein n=1 Tax=Bacillus swezeyi TaxID=1925020 RepID=UPI0027DB5A30|nr:IseA DL-endopeptidase inhibitor family protein [Bacillus swezeyi]
MKKFIVCLLTALLILPIGTTIAAKKQTSGDLTNQQVMTMTLQAREHFWNTMSGHNPKAKNSSCQTKTFEHRGIPYTYMCSEFSTKAKLTDYLTPIFTTDAIKKGFDKYNIIAYKGKMAVPVGDGDNLLGWEQAKMKLISKKDNVRTYEFAVPALDGSVTAKRKITFVKENNKWKINQLDAAF